ncbi:MAG: hypothetical protein ABIZ80_05115, partial [Bryobacteraceae bacterium]
ITAGGQTFTITQAAPGIVIQPNVVTNAASYAVGSVSPGMIVTIFVSGAGPQTPATLQLNPDGRGVSTTLATTRVLFDGVAAPMVAALATQVSAVVPYVTGSRATTQLQVEYQGIRSNLISVPVVSAIPGLFSLNGSGTGPGAILNQDNSLNSATNPIPAGDIVLLYGTGEGQTVPAGGDGLLAVAPLPRPGLPVGVKIGGVDAEVLYAGAAPGLVSGVIQVNVRIPATARSGNLPVVMRIGLADSQTGLTVAVK